MTKKNESSPRADQRERLIKQLELILPDVDNQGLLFLIRQANTLIHNQEVERINAERAELEPEGPGVFEGGRSLDIDRSPDQKTYYLIVDGKKHFLSIEEMQDVVQLCYRPETKSAALKFLFEYFSAERKEILMDHGIEAVTDPFFELLFREIRTVFTLD